MREETPQIAEHAFGTKCEQRAVVKDPEFAIMLGLRRYGWMTYEQCRIRVFSWNSDYANEPSPKHRYAVLNAIFELEELGLVEVVVSNESLVLTEFCKYHGILQVHLLEKRLTKRYEHAENKGVDTDETEKAKLHDNSNIADAFAPKYKVPVKKKIAL